MKIHVSFNEIFKVKFFFSKPVYLNSTMNQLQYFHKNNNNLFSTFNALKLLSFLFIKFFFLVEYRVAMTNKKMGFSI